MLYRACSMRVGRALLAICTPGLFGVAGCGGSATAPDEPMVMTYAFDFRPAAPPLASPPDGNGPWNGLSGWVGGFADFGPQQLESMELDAGHRPLPQTFGGHTHGLFIGATNRSDDVFMFWTGKVDGLEPRTRYEVRFEVEFATNSPSGCFGAGGAPGEAVWVKAGATLQRPESVWSPQEDYWRMNVDKGEQAGGGDAAVVIGNVANGISECVGEWVWTLKTLTSEEDFQISTDATGAVWLLVGTDSGFESRTELYYTRYKAVFTPL